MIIISGGERLRILTGEWTIFGERWTGADKRLGADMASKQRRKEGMEVRV